MFKVGDRVRIRSLGDFDAQSGVRVGMVGTVTFVQDYASYFWAAGDAHRIEFDEQAGMTARWMHVADLELVPAIAPKRKGFQVGDRVIVVRGRGVDIELDDLERHGLLGRFGAVSNTGDGYDYTVKFTNWNSGWGSGGSEWGINKTNLRRVTVQNVNG